MDLKKSLLIALSFTVVNILCAQPYAYHPDDENTAESCTSIMVGKKASTDGSVMTAHSCDSNYRTWLTIEKHKKANAGDTEPVYWGKLHTEEPHDIRNVTEKGRIPAVAETYSYLNVAYPCLNEKQLAIGETTTSGRGELENENGLFLIEELERVALQRCSTARDAIKLMGALAEEYGYGDGGECLTVADKNEVWHFEIYGNGKIKENPAVKNKKNKKVIADKPGAIWVAQRIPDDHVGVSANIPRISTVDFNNPDYFMYSSDIKERTQKLGLWDGKSEFKFYKVVSKGKPFSYREYWVLNTLAPSLGLKYDSEELPFSVKPEKKVSPEQMFTFYRETYQGTEWDQVKNLAVAVDRRRRDENGKSVSYKDTVYPVSTFMPGDMRTLLNTLKEGATKRIRTIAVIQCAYSHVTQLRNWLPDEIGGVCYFSFDNPAQSPRIPIYSGSTELPKGFDVCGQARYREDAAIWAYRETNRIATINWDKTRHLIEDQVAYYEKQMMQENPVVEAQAAQLIKEGKKGEAVKLLNNYTAKIAAATSKTWEDIRAELWTIFARGM
ncbi:MAG: C69 family dipeptidase [Bacteroidales bacterium]